MIDLHRLAFRELRDARRYYGARSSVAAERFERGFDVATARLARNPNGCDIVHGAYRSVRFKKFPFRVIFVIEPEGSLFIIAVAHDRRRPNYWSRRTRLN